MLVLQAGSRRAEIPPPLNITDAELDDGRSRLADQAEALRSHEARLQNDLTELGVDLRQGKQEHDALTGEIESLKARRSNIPAEQIAMRAALCRALDFDEADMPFAGELLQVREEERDWEGAAERLLRNFGLSLLVPRNGSPASTRRWARSTTTRGATSGWRHCRRPMRTCATSRRSCGPAPKGR